MTRTEAVYIRRHNSRLGHAYKKKIGDSASCRRKEHRQDGRSRSFSICVSHQVIIVCGTCRNQSTVMVQRSQSLVPHHNSKAGDRSIPGFENFTLSLDENIAVGLECSVGASKCVSTNLCGIYHVLSNSPAHPEVFKRTNYHSRPCENWFSCIDSHTSAYAKNIL